RCFSDGFSRHRNESDAMSEFVETASPIDVEEPAYLIGVRLREPLMAEDHLTTAVDLHVGEFVVVETAAGTAVAEVRRPHRPLPEFKRGRLYRRVLRRATEAETAEWRERRRRELDGVLTCQRLARAKGLAIKIVDVEIEAARRRVTVLFNSEERVDF